MRYKDRLPWQICCGGLFFIAVTPPCTTKGHNKGVTQQRGQAPCQIKVSDKGVRPLGDPLGGHLIETQEKEMLTWLLYLIWMESFWTQSNWL